MKHQHLDHTAPDENDRTSRTPIDPRDLTEQRELLERQRRALLADLLHDLHDARAGVDATPADEPKDELEASAAMERESTRFSLMHMKGETLDRVNEALDRINNGTYGRCEACDEPIAASRLRALPFAVRCRHCQEQRESLEQAQARGSRLMKRLRLES
jgi:DnaK suppressor protein